MTLLEVCVESSSGALAAEAGGAARVELCANLLEGGTTPSLGSIRLAVERLRIPTMVMVRPRGGDFLYSADELDVMRRDVELVRDAGAAGVVLGLLTPDGEVDAARTAELVERARPLQVTFHRAFDMTREPFAALERLIELGVERVLTSGQKDDAPSGAALIRELHERAAGRIGILPGGGITLASARRLVEETGVDEVHLAALATEESGMRWRNEGCTMGAGEPLGEYELLRTDPALVRAVVAALS
jgi:copper homeostasis protein